MKEIKKIEVLGQQYGVADMLMRGVMGGNAQVIEWSHTHNMNDYKEAGTYRIKGERTGNSMDDNLPIMNSGSGHTIDGILYVLDSSLTNGSGKEDDCTITQFLMLSNRVGGQEGDMYMRSGYGPSKDDVLAWKPWEKYQTNMEVGVVSDDATHDPSNFAPINTNGLNSFVDNGIYSGVYLTQEVLGGDSTKAQTFVMVVINNYVIADANKTITQIKFAVATNGTYSQEYRTLGADGLWSEWNNGVAAVTIVNDLTTGGADKALSAEMGKELKDTSIITENNIGRFNVHEYRDLSEYNQFVVLERPFNSNALTYRCNTLVGDWVIVLKLEDGTSLYHNVGNEGVFDVAEYTVTKGNVIALSLYLKPNAAGEIDIDFVFGLTNIVDSISNNINVIDESKLSKEQGLKNAGKAMVVNHDGSLSPLLDAFEFVVAEESNIFNKNKAEVYNKTWYRTTEKLFVADNAKKVIVSLNVMTHANKTYSAKVFPNGVNDIDDIISSLSSWGVNSIIPIESPSSTIVVGFSQFSKNGYSMVTNRGGGYLQGVSGGQYLYLAVEFATEDSLKNNLPNVLKWLKVVEGDGIKWDAEYEAYQQPIAQSILASKSDLNGKLDANQGEQNAGKTLKVGADGEIILTESADADTDVTGCVRKKLIKKLNLGANLIDGIVGSGENWSHADGTYTHTTGKSEPLVFDLPTEIGSAYVVTLYTGVEDFYETYVNVSIGDGELCDIYKGMTGPYHVGIISDGGKLKITPNSNYASNVHSIELRKVVSADEAEKTIEYPSLNVNIDDGDNLTGFWNVAIAAQNTMTKLQNGSRNIGIGLNCLSEMTSGERNIGIGTFAMNQLKWGIRNIAIGADALYRCSQASSNVAIGKAAAGFTHADPTAHVYNYNVAVGYDALGSTANNYTNNTALGAKAMGGGTVGKDRTGNVAVGYESGYYCGTDNVSIGSGSNRYTKGDRNVSVGANTGDITETGSRNILIGAGAKVKSGEGTWQNPTTHNDCIVVGTDAVATKDGQVIIGTAAQTEVVIMGKKLTFNPDGSVTWKLYEA